MRAAAFLIVAGILSGCAADAEPRSAAPAGAPSSMLVERVHLTMGTELRVSAWTADERRAVDAFSAVFDEFDRIDRLMSVWKPESDIVRLNAAAGEHPVKVSRDTIDVLRTAREVSEWTGGRFDVTFGALSGLWKFDQDQDGRVPDPRAVAAALPLIDYRALIVDEQAGTAFLRRKGMRANLGGIGKGYAVDRAVAILRARGLRDFIIQAGGDMYVAGRRGDRPWRVGIRDPRGPADRSFAAIDLTDATFSTSGDYERFFMRDGLRYHHIIDPASGQPARASRSVTVVTSRAIIADAIAKGIFIAGGRAGLELAARVPGVEAVIVTSRNEVLVSPALKSHLVMLASPTDAP